MRIIEEIVSKCIFSNIFPLQCSWDSNLLSWRPRELFISLQNLARANYEKCAYYIFAFTQDRIDVSNDVLDRGVTWQSGLKKDAFRILRLENQRSVSWHPSLPKSFKLLSYKNFLCKCEFIYGELHIYEIKCRNKHSHVWKGNISRFARSCKNAKICEKLENSSSQWKPVEEEVERAPTRAAIFAKNAKIANILKSAKNWKIRRASENL